MSEAQVLHYTGVAMIVVLTLSLPALLVTTLIGVTIGIVQALTQIQDQALPFAIKVIVVTLVMVFTAPWLGSQLLDFARQLFDNFYRIGL